MAKKTTRKKTVKRPKSSGSAKFRQLAAAMRKFATSFDGVREDYPWGERVVKGPNGKVFVFLGDPYMLDGSLCFTVKLTKSRKDVLKLSFAKPCGYGLGKHGWVTLKIAPPQTPPTLTKMKSWIAESHAAVAGARTKRV